MLMRSDHYYGTAVRIVLAPASNLYVVFLPGWTRPADEQLDGD